MDARYSHRRRAIIAAQWRWVMNGEHCIASIVLAAGRGSRMKQFHGNKTLLPLKPDASPFKGSNPILLHILNNLPPGPKSIVVHFDKESVMDATKQHNPTYCIQPELNGTGGALLAAQTFLEQQGHDRVLITMGDVPLVKRQTYDALIHKLNTYHMVVLGFCPQDKREYGVLAIENGYVSRIIENKYWKDLSTWRQKRLKVCNSGIYAARGEVLLEYLSILAERPHIVKKKVENRSIEFEEYFITDLVENMSNAGLAVGYMIAENEDEVMGVDDMDTLGRAQELFREKYL
jgi:bifunctional UDP-N-acetylglucosamine pyrophosphorylase/glucosamine-1-phosphate N-acetyltransferase